MPKVSVIIPVYNVEKYLERCLLSVVNQSLDDIEIIIINDGSPDNSQTIIDKYSAMDKRIRAVIKKNGGLGPARNTGMELATGKYIAFVDSDDWIELNMLEELYNKAVENSADIVICNANNCLDDGTTEKKFSMKSGIVENETIHSQQFLYSYFFGGDSGINAWNKLYNTDFLKSNMLLYEENDKIFAEDLLFNLYCIVHARRLVLVDKCLYNYFIRQTSIIHTYKPMLTERYINLIYRFDRYLSVYPRGGKFRWFCPLLVFNAVSCSLSNAYKYRDQHPQGLSGELDKYLDSRVCRQYIGELAVGKCLKNIPNIMWKLFARIFGLLAYRGAGNLACIMHILRFRTITGIKVEKKVATL